MSNNRKKTATRRRKLERLRAADQPLELKDTLMLTLPTIQTEVDQVALNQGAKLIRLPGKSLFQAGPDGIDIAPGSQLRYSAPTDAPLTAAALMVELRMNVTVPAKGGAYLSLIGIDGLNVMVRDLGDRWMVQVGRARIAIVPTFGTTVTLCFAVTASGWLIVSHDDGYVEEMAAFDPIPALQFRQIQLGHKAPMVLQGLRIDTVDKSGADKLRADFKARNNASICAPMLIHFNGQSLAVGPLVPPEQRMAISALGRSAVRMLTGVHTGEARRGIELQGMQARDEQIDISGAHLTKVKLTTHLPPAAAMAQALAAHDPARQIVISGNPSSAQKIAVLEDEGRPMRRNMDAVMQATHRAMLHNGEMPSDIAYFWIQGEADRHAAPGEYLASLTGHWQRMRGHLDALYPKARKTILLMQTAGSDATHHPSESHHPATDQAAFVAAHADAVLVGPIYPARLHDSMHPDLHSSRVMGELAAWALAEVQAGQAWSIPTPTLTRDDDRITLHFALRKDEGLAAHDDIYRGSGIDQHLGFQAEGGGHILSVQPDGHKLHLTVSGPVTEIRYAMQRQNMRFEGNSYPARRGLLRTTLTKAAVHLPDTLLYRWIPSFYIAA